MSRYRRLADTQGRDKQMNNHPNRSKSSALRYVAYSVASHNALSDGSDYVQARERARAAYQIANGDYLVIFSTRSEDDLSRFDGGRWPADAAIVWRGGNELAQKYRATRRG
jgi:hypothetical protein